MIEALAIRNYQSLKNVGLRLGKFTVIVGPSSSGKSALVRAVKLLVSNSRGAPYVTHGQKVASVSAVVDGQTVTIERGEGVGLYKLVVDGAESTFSKLGGTVPPEVTALLGVPPVKDSSLNFAGQFDRPYLLDDTGSEVARTLGALTNVHILFEASREANRRSRAAGTQLKVRVADLERLMVRAQEFKGLKERREAQQLLEHQLNEAGSLANRIRNLSSLVEQLEIAESALARAEAKASIEIPDVQALDQAQSRLLLFKQIIGEVSNASRLVGYAKRDLETADESLTSLHVRQHDLLEAAGTCPTCGQSTKELTSV